MASMVSRFALCFALFSSTPALALTAPPSDNSDKKPAPALNVPVAPNAQGEVANQTQPVASTLPARAAVSDSVVSNSINQWRRLTSSSNVSFGEVAQFLMQNPDWPNEDNLRKMAETAPLDYGFSPNQAVAYFNRFPPLTGGGWMRYAVALSSSGQRDQATIAARKAWASKSLNATDEARMMQQFMGSLTSADHEARMDALLLSGQTSAAARQLGFISGPRRAVFDARLAMRTRASDTWNKAAAADAMGQNDPGYIVDKATWLRGTGQSGPARALLERNRQLTSHPSDVEEWYETLLVNARAAAADNQWNTAYNIARQVDDAYPHGTSIKEKDRGVRDDYTSLVWLAGTTAMDRLNRAHDAEGLFLKYAEAARSPQTQSKGYYWAGRAALRAGHADHANRFFKQAAQHFDQFYGQLAIERLGLPQPVHKEAPANRYTQADQHAFQSRTVVQATRILGRQGDWSTQSKFVRAIGDFARSGPDHYFGAQLAREIGRQDLSVMIGRSARMNGLNDYTTVAFPVTNVPPSESDQWTMIHAITRQESQFDRRIISRAGATGMMQLMPGTARETAGKIGRGYSYEMLYEPQYNIMLGSTYFRGLMSQFGSFPLAVAAYNAGPGNVRKWLRNNGDPRTGQIDILDWIEDIPLSETRGYVHHVLENAVIYDTLNPSPRNRREKNPLSYYLGKSNKPG